MSGAAADSLGGVVKALLLPAEQHRHGESAACRGSCQPGTVPGLVGHSGPTFCTGTGREGAMALGQLFWPPLCHPGHRSLPCSGKKWLKSAPECIIYLPQYAGSSLPVLPVLCPFSAIHKGDGAPDGAEHCCSAVFFLRIPTLWDLLCSMLSSSSSTDKGSTVPSISMI